MHRDLTGYEIGYNVDFATRDSFVLMVATTAATVSVSLYDVNGAQEGSTVTRNK